MIASIAVSLALTGAAEVVATHAPHATFERLAAAANPRRGDAALAARLDRMDALRLFVARAHQRMLADHFQGADLFNTLQVVRDLVETGSGLAVLPEERLCWQRAGLNLAFDHYRIVSARVAAGAFPPQHLDQARAQFEFFRAGYNRALAECTPTPR